MSHGSRQAYSDGEEEMSLHIVPVADPAHSQARTPAKGGREGIRGLVAHQARIRRAEMRNSGVTALGSTNTVMHSTDTLHISDTH
jgi:hypothetical protein